MTVVDVAAQRPPAAPQGSAQLTRVRSVLARLGWVPMLVILLILVGLPIGYLIFGSLRTAAPALPGTWTLSKFDFLVSSEFLHLAWNSVIIAVAGSAIAFVVALLLVLGVCRMNMPFRRTIDGILVLPGYLPPFMVALAWIMLMSPRTGYLTAALSNLGLPAPNIFSMAGIIWVMALCSTPIAYLYLRPAVLALDSSLEEAARIGGASRWQTMRWIVLGLMRPALLSTAVVVFVTALGEFAVPAILGPIARIYTISSTIYQLVSEYPDDPNKAAVLGLLLIAISVIGLMVSRRIANRHDYTTIGPRARLPRNAPRTRGTWVAFILCLLFAIVSVVLPVAAIVIGSLQPYLSPTFDSGWTLHNFRSLTDYAGAGPAIVNTVELSVLTAVIGIVLAIGLARMSVRRKSRASGFLGGMSSTTLAVPHVVFGLGLLWMWVSLHRLGLYGTRWLLLVAYLGLFLPFGVRALAIAFRQFDPVLEEAGRMSGASRARVSMRIVTPILAPAVLSGATVILYHSMRELSASLLLFTPGNQVMSVQIWGLYDQGNFVEVMALGLLNIALVLVVVGIANRIAGSRRGL
jgi:iron(III) transport system permease protein